MLYLSSDVTVDKPAELWRNKSQEPQRRVRVSSRNTRKPPYVSSSFFLSSVIPFVMKCTRCGRGRPIEDFRWSSSREGYNRKRARFDEAIARGEIPTDRTLTCTACRNITSVTASDTASAQRQRECKEYYESLRTECEQCGEARKPCLMLCKKVKGDPVKPLSNTGYWAASTRGVDAMRIARSKFRVLCSFCCSVSPWTTDPPNEFDTWLNAHIVGVVCEVCNRESTSDTYRGFQLAHYDSAQKTVDMYQLRKLVRDGTLDVAVAKRLAIDEFPLGRFLCNNCHRMESRRLEWD